MTIGEFKIGKLNNSARGVTIIEAVVGVALVSMIIIALYTALFNVTRLFSEAKQKAIVTALANEKMEIIRNLDYADIGVVDWVPEGPILQTEVVEKHNYEYTVDTAVEYVDDPFDGQGEDDDVETDYKQVRIEISWLSYGKEKMLTFVSTFVPDGLESEIGGGVLSVNVVDETGAPIVGARVDVDSVDENPAIHGYSTTDNQGNVRLPGMPQQEYALEVSKDGYETIGTYGSSGAGFTPTELNVLVVDGEVVLKTFVLKEAAAISLNASDIVNDSGIENIPVHLKGGRLIGTDPDTYDYDETENTDSSGDINYSSMSPGEYLLLETENMETDDSQYVGSESEIPIMLDPGENQEIKLLFADKSVDSLVLWIKDRASGLPVKGAQVSVSGNGFDQSNVSRNDGSVYFPETKDPPETMVSGEYQIEVSVAGYQDYSGNINVSQLTESTIEVDAL